jgi:hypothetical protein
METTGSSSAPPPGTWDALGSVLRSWWVLVPPRPPPEPRASTGSDIESPMISIVAAKGHMHLLARARVALRSPAGNSARGCAGPSKAAPAADHRRGSRSGRESGSNRRWKLDSTRRFSRYRTCPRCIDGLLCVSLFCPAMVLDDQPSLNVPSRVRRFSSTALGVRRLGA